MKEIYLISFILLFSVTSFAQNIEGKELFELKKPLQKSVITCGNLNGEGFVIGAGNRVYKYTNDFHLQWSAELDDYYEYKEYPDSEIYGNEKHIFLYQKEVQSNGRFVITSFSDDGEAHQLEYKDKDKPHGVVDVYLTDEGLNVLVYYLNKESINYKIFCFSSELELSTKKVVLPHDEYEIREDPRNCRWKPLATKGDTLILVKSYFKDIEGSKQKNLITQTIEVFSDGKADDVKEYTFNSLSDEVKYFNPTIIYNDLHETLTVIGYSTKRKQDYFIEGFYIYRYDYVTRQAKEKDLYYLSEMNQFLGEIEISDKVPVNLKKMYAIDEFLDYTYCYNKENDAVTLYILDNVLAFLNKAKYSINAVTVDRDNGVAMVQLKEYNAHLKLYNKYRLTPHEGKKLNYTKHGFEHNLPLQFIEQKKFVNHPELLAWKILEKDDRNIFISFDEGSQKVKGYSTLKYK